MTALRTATFQLPWPPSVNAAYRSVMIGRSPRVLLSRDGREYKRRAAWELLRQRVPGFGNARVSVHVEVCPPDRRRRDLGNLDKLLLDALLPRVLTDDSQIDLLTWDRRAWRIVPGGLLRLTVTELPHNTRELALEPARKRVKDLNPITAALED